MTDPMVNFRDPWPPHAIRASTRVANLRYGFMLCRDTKAALDISRADPNAGEAFDFGALVTIERSDGLLPWAGYVARRTLSISKPTGAFTLKDFASAILARARTALDWEERSTSSGALIREVFADAAQRARPPILLTIDDSVAGGPYLSHTVRGEYLLTFLRTMCSTTDWEWSIGVEIDRHEVRHRLTWQERVGHDHVRGTDALVFEQGRHFRDADLVEDAETFLEEGFAIGGTGEVRDRPAQFVARTGLGSSVPTAPARSRAARSPVLMGTRGAWEPNETSPEALATTARRAYEARDWIGEHLTFSFVESTVDMNLIELGGVYGVRFKDLVLGLGYEREIRIHGLGLGEDGVVDVEAEVLP